MLRRTSLRYASVMLQCVSFMSSLTDPVAKLPGI